MMAQAAPVSSVQQIREARLQPLKVALQDAIALHTKATGVREALEAEVGRRRRRGAAVHAAGGSGGGACTCRVARQRADARRMRAALLVRASAQVCALFERVISAEGTDVDLDQVCSWAWGSHGMACMALALFACLPCAGWLCWPLVVGAMPDRILAAPPPCPPPARRAAPRLLLQPWRRLRAQ